MAHCEWSNMDPNNYTHKHSTAKPLPNHMGCNTSHRYN